MAEAFAVWIRTDTVQLLSNSKILVRTQTECVLSTDRRGILPESICNGINRCEDFHDMQRKETSPPFRPERHPASKDSCPLHIFWSCEGSLIRGAFSRIFTDRYYPVSHLHKPHGTIRQNPLGPTSVGIIRSISDSASPLPCVLLPCPICIRI